MKLLFFSLFFSLRLLGQTDTPLRFEPIEGLSQNTVYSILKDKQGFMWMATANGLNRFDGVEMKAYKPGLENKEGDMKGRIIRSSLLEDDQEQLWFATDVTVNCFNKRKQKFSQHKLYFDLSGKNEGKEELPTTHLFANPLLKKDNYLWLASATEGLFVMNMITGKSINYRVSIEGNIESGILLMYHAAWDGKHKFWFAGQKGLLCFDLNTHKWSWYLKNESFYVATILQDTVYLGNKDGFFWFDTKSFRNGSVSKTKQPADQKDGLVRAFYRDERMNIWSGDQAGNIYCKSPGQNNFEWRGNINGTAESKTQYPVYCLYADTVGNLWVGADVLGLLKAEIKPTVFKSYPSAIPRNEASQNLFIHSIYEDEKENIWLGTFQNGLLVVNKQNGETSTVKFPYYDPSLPYAKSVPLIKKDSRDNLWTSYSGWLYVKEKEGKEFLPVRFPLPAHELQSPQLWNITEYKNGWLLATNTGVYFVEKINNEYKIKLAGGLDGRRVLSLWVAPDEEVWVIPETGGIIVFSDIENKKIQAKLFTGENIKSVRYDKEHRLVWIASVTGFIAYHFPTGKYKLYNEKNGLLNSYVYGSIENKNEIWLSTNNGLSKGVLEFDDSSFFPQIRFTNFTSADGLPGNEFNTGAFYKGQSGNLYFGSTHGVTWFKPEDINVSHSKPRVQVIDFFVNNEAADSLLAPEYISSLKLPFTKNNLFFRFRSIDFNEGDDIQYRYRLQGWDKDWIYSNLLNEVRYNNLPYGSYVFNVQASANQDDWDTDIKSISIIINPPFWKTGWFYALLIAGILIVVVLITKFFAQQKLKAKVHELEKQKELDRERQRISREMHDDLGAGLTQITLMSESAKSKSSIPELNDIATTSRQLVNNMSEIVWSLNPENKSLDQLCAYLREELNNLLEYSGMGYHINFPENKTDIMLSGELRRNVLLVTKEIVNNAVKYSKAKNISIKAELEQNKLKFEITDDGIGFDAEKTYSGNGLKNICNRINELAGGKMEIESSAGKGSRFVYTFQINTT